MTSHILRFGLIFLVACMLTVFPLPSVLLSFRPPWVLIVILYIQFYCPEYFNMMIILFLGICLDVLLSTVLGEHAFALIITTWIASGKARRFYFFSMVQQMLLIGLFCVIYQLIIYVIDSFLGYQHLSIMVVGSAFVGMLFWPWLRFLMYDLSTHS